MEDIKKFKFFCQKVLPLVYDDSLSYYEVLCKMLSKLNEMIDSLNENNQTIEALREEFRQLQVYVDNYFKNLDLQKEVNTIIEEYIRNGKIEEIVGDEIFPNIMNQLESLQNQVNQLVPNPGEPTEGNAELINIRTSANGVIFQTAGNAVRTQIIAQQNNDYFEQVYTADHRLGWYYNIVLQTFSQLGDLNHAVAVFPADSSLYLCGGTILGTSQALVAFLDADYKLIQFLYRGNSPTVVDHYDNIAFVCPDSAKYFAISYLYNNYNDYYVKVATWLPNHDYSIPITSYDRTHRYLTTAGEFITDGFSNMYDLAIIPVVAGDRYNISGTLNGTRICFIVFLDSTNKIVSQYYRGFGNATNTVFQNLHVVIPSGVTKLAINFFNYGGATISVQKIIKTNLPVVTGWSYGKNFAALGDSKTQGIQNMSDPTYSWTKYLQSMLSFSQVTTLGLGGSKITDTTSTGFIERAKNIPTATNLICVWGGINDYWSSVPLGTISDTQPTTFYGALDTLLMYLLSNLPGSFLFFITPEKSTLVPSRNNNGNTLAEFSDAVVYQCAKYGVPVLDFFNNSSISPSIQQQKELFMSDGLHETFAGYQRIAYRIAAFIRSTF